jgi:purine-binding chemotaxis protein CheW
VIRTQQYCTFFVDGLLFGVEVGKVQEVVDVLELTPVPLAPPAVRGLINLRGQIVTAIDLRTRLDLPQAAGGQRPKNVIVDGSDGVVSLQVDAVGDIVEVNPECFETPPATLPAATRSLVTGIYQLPNHLLLALGLDEVQRVPGQISAP